MRSMTGKKRKTELRKGGDLQGLFGCVKMCETCLNFGMTPLWNAENACVASRMRGAPHETWTLIPGSDATQLHQ